jgi:hypothetical protein
MKKILACPLPQNQQERQKCINNYKNKRIGRDFSIALAILVSTLAIVARISKSPYQSIVIFNLLVSGTGLSLTQQNYRQVNGKPIFKLMLEEERGNPFQD